MNEGKLRAWPSAPTARPSPPDTLGGGGGGVVLWDVADASGSGRAARREEGDVESVAFSPDGKTIAAGYTSAAAAAAGWCCGTRPTRAAARTSHSP